MRIKNIPLKLKIRYLCFSKVNLILLVFLIFLVSIHIRKMKQADFSKEQFNLQNSQEIIGEIIDVGYYPKSKVGEALYEYKYRFEINDTIFQGISYAPKKDVKPESIIFYNVDAPSYSVLKGMKRKPHSDSDLSGSLFFILLIISGIIVYTLHRNNFLKMLQRNFRIADAKLENSKYSQFAVNKRITYKCIFNFKDLTGIPRFISIMTHDPEQYSKEIVYRVIFDPTNPKLVYFMPSLPIYIQDFLDDLILRYQRKKSSSNHNSKPNI